MPAPVAIYQRSCRPLRKSIPKAPVGSILFAATLLATSQTFAQETGSKSAPATPPAPAVIAVGAGSQNTAAMQRGIAAAQQREWNTAAREFEAIIKDEPGNVTALDFYGMALLMLGQAEKAIPVLQDSLKRQPENLPTLVNLGNAYLTKPGATTADFAAAVSSFEKAVALKRTSPDAQTGLGTAALRAGDYSKAETAYRSLLELPDRNTDDDAHTYVALGFTLQRQGKADDAVTALKKGTDLKPDQPDAWALLGSLYLQQSKQADALIALETARKLAPDNYSTTVNLAQVYAAQKRYSDAAQMYDAVVTLATARNDTAGRREALYNRAELLHLLGQDKEASTVYDTLIAEDPNNYDALMNSASILYAQTDLSKAQARFAAAATLRPDSPTPLEGQGKIYEQQGQQEKAAVVWGRAATLTSDKNHKFELYRFQASNLLTARRWEDLRAVTVRMKALRPRDGVPDTLTGLSYQIESDSESLAKRKQDLMVRALAAFQSAVKKDPGNALAYNNIGVLHEKRGEIPLAIAAYKKALVADPQFAEARRNLKRYGGTGTRQPRTGTITP